MKLRKRFSAFLLIMLIPITLFGIILPTSFEIGTDDATASSSQSGLIKVALTKNVSPRSDWSNGTLYHLRILQKFLPINITIITDFTALNDYQVLFLNMLNISDDDIETIANWVDDGGFLVCIGQSGRYNEVGAERASHPLALPLGITLDGWERTSGAEVRHIITRVNWHWWSSWVVYDIANNGDGLYWELADIYYIPKSETVNVTLNGATLTMSCRDKFYEYEEPFLTSNMYGLGRAFFIASDAFYRLVWKPPKEEFGLYNNENSLTAGYWFRSGLLWQTLYAIMLDCFSNIPLPIITSMPHGYYSAINFGLKVAVTDYAYGNLTQSWKPEIFDKHPELKGWFWGFWLITSGINETSNATNIVNLVKEYGYAGSRSETGALQHYLVAHDFLRSYGFEYEYEGSSGLGIRIKDMVNLIKNWNFTNIFYLRRISGRLEHGAEISSIPTPICNHTGVINFFASPYIYPPEWTLLIERQKILGDNYGIGGLCTGNTYVHWVGQIADADRTINTFIDDDSVWTTNGSTFFDWWNKRWKINMTDFSASSREITVDLQTPNVQGLTLLLKGRDDISEVTVDGIPLTPHPESNRIVIPQLSEGIHKVVIKFMFNSDQLKMYNDALKVEGKPYVKHCTQTVEYINYAHQRLTLDFSGVSTELKVYSLRPPRKVFAEGKPISFIYSNITNIATMLVPSAHVDIYYAQPVIAAFWPSRLEYKTGETVELTLKTYGDYSTSDAVKWLVRVTVLDEAERIVVTMDEQIEIRVAVAETLQFTVKNLSQGDYTTTVEMSDPEVGNILAMDSLTISVTKEPTALLLFDTVQLEMYNDGLKSKGLPYVEGSTQTIVDIAFSSIYQRLSITLNVHSGVSTELKVYSLRPPRKVFAEGKPISFIYSNITNIATMLVPSAHVDIYYAQPVIAAFWPSRLEYKTGETVELTLKIDGDYSTSDAVKWLVRLTIVRLHKNGTEKIVKTVYEEVELNEPQSLVVGNFPVGTYAITVEIIDPETENILETHSLHYTIRVEEAARARTEVPLVPVILATTIVTIIGVAVYTWYRLKKSKSVSSRSTF